MRYQSHGLTINADKFVQITMQRLRVKKALSSPNVLVHCNSTLKTVHQTNAFRLHSVRYALLQEQERSMAPCSMWLQVFGRRRGKIRYNWIGASSSGMGYGQV